MIRSYQSRKGLIRSVIRRPVTHLMRCYQICDQMQSQLIQQFMMFERHLERDLTNRSILDAHELRHFCRVFASPDSHTTLHTPLCPSTCCIELLLPRGSPIFYCAPLIRTYDGEGYPGGQPEGLDAPLGLHDRDRHLRGRVSSAFGTGIACVVTTKPSNTSCPYARLLTCTPLEPWPGWNDPAK